MKSILSIAMLLITMSVFASESETCTASKEGDHACETAKNSPKHEKKEGHHDHSAKMNALYPGKAKDPSLSNKPGTVELLSPKFLEEIGGTNAKLTWKETSGASVYHVQVATDPNFKWLVSNDQNVKGTSFEITTLEAGKKYYWRVAARAPENDPSFTKSNFVNSAFQTK